MDLELSTDLVALLDLVVTDKHLTLEVGEGVIMEVAAEAGQVEAEDHLTAMGQYVLLLGILLLVLLEMEVSRFRIFKILLQSHRPKILLSLRQ